MQEERDEGSCTRSNRTLLKRATRPRGGRAPARAPRLAGMVHTLVRALQRPCNIRRALEARCSTGHQYSPPRAIARRARYRACARALALAT